MVLCDDKRREAAEKGFREGEAGGRGEGRAEACALRETEAGAAPYPYIIHEE